MLTFLYACFTAKFLETADEAHPDGLDSSLDENFRSGVELGAGLISLILSLLPSTVLKVVEVFGFSGDREYALRTLMRPGRWQTGAQEPGMDPEKEGVRRPREFDKAATEANRWRLTREYLCSGRLDPAHVPVRRPLSLSASSHADPPSLRPPAS